MSSPRACAEPPIRRLEAAKVDLTYRPDTVLTSAQRWGFTDHSHFTRRSKAAYGVTPYEYSRRVREDGAAEQTPGAGMPEDKLSPSSRGVGASALSGR